jgi:hypothetical protein
MGLPESVSREKKHHRKIDCEGYLRSDGLWDIDVHMVDTRAPMIVPTTNFTAMV